MSKAIGPFSIQDWLRDRSDLKALSRAARSHQPDPSQPLELPPALADRTTVVRESHRLILIAENNAVAQLLRFHAPRLASAAGVAQAEVRVRPKTGTGAASSPGDAPRLSAAAAECLMGCAEEIDDPKLAETLRRLASRADESDSQT